MERFATREFTLSKHHSCSKATDARPRLEPARTAVNKIHEMTLLPVFHEYIRALPLGWPDAAAYKPSIEYALRPWQVAH